jgi:hypothetical protein
MAIHKPPNAFLKQAGGTIGLSSRTASAPPETDYALHIGGLDYRPSVLRPNSKGKHDPTEVHVCSHKLDLF